MPSSVLAGISMRVKATRREFLGRATALGANPNTMLACNGPITDPVIALPGQQFIDRELVLPTRLLDRHPTAAHRLFETVPASYWLQAGLAALTPPSATLGPNSGSA
jgi:hypothetical protein